jgi:hypothetical protein
VSGVSISNITAFSLRGLLIARYKAENYALQFETLDLGRDESSRMYLWWHRNLSRFGTQLA